MSRILAAGRNLARSLSFAHLSGVTGAHASDDDDGDPKDKKDAKADDGDDDEEDTPPKKDKDAKSKAKSKAKAEDDDSEKDEDDKPKSTKAKSKADDEDPEAKDGDDDDEEMRGNSAAADARRRERARCAAIFACKAAATNTQLAAHLAFNTTMTRSEAVGALGAAPVPEPNRARGSHPDRKDANPHLSTNGGGSQPRSVQVAKSLDAAFAAVNPKRNKR